MGVICGVYVHNNYKNKINKTEIFTYVRALITHCKNSLLTVQVLHLYIQLKKAATNSYFHSFFADYFHDYEKILLNIFLIDCLVFKMEKYACHDFLHFSISPFSPFEKPKGFLIFYIFSHVRSWNSPTLQFLFDFWIMKIVDDDFLYIY